MENIDIDKEDVEEAPEETPEEEPQKTEDDLVPREHYTNLQKALRESRGKMRALQSRLEDAEKKLTELTEKAKVNEDEELFKEYADEDAVTVHGAKQLNKRLKDTVEKTVVDLRREFNQATVDVAEEFFRETHPDYDDVIDSVKDRIKDPEFVKYVMAEGSARIPKRLYEYAKRQVQEPVTAKETESIDLDEGIKKIKTPSKPATMSLKSKTAGPKSTENLSLDDLRKLTPAQREARWMKSLEKG